MALTPCKECTFFFKPSWRVTHEQEYPEDMQRSECHREAPRVFTDEYADATWPMPFDDAPGCGDGERKKD